MTKCNNCGRKLRLIDWRPNCPDCGVNLNYFNANERLLNDSEKAEIEHAHFQPKVDRAKASTIGTKTGIIRMILFIIPIAVLFLPVYSVTVGGVTEKYNAIAVFNVIGDLDIATLLSDISPLVLTIIFAALAAVLCLVFTILQITSGTAKGLKRNVAYSGIITGLIVASVVSFSVFNTDADNCYMSFVLHEAEYAVNGGSQENADAAFDKLNVNGENTADFSRLERAIKTAEETLSEKEKYGYTAEELEAIEAALTEAKTLYAQSDAGKDEIREAAAKLNSAVYAYGSLENLVNLADSDGRKNDDGVYSDEYYEQLTVATAEAEKVFTAHLDRAGATDGADIYSEATLNNLSSSIVTLREYLEKLANGELIVDAEDDDGTGNKTEKELVRDTASTLSDGISAVNSALCSLTDISRLVPLAQKVTAEIDSGTAEYGVSGSICIGAYLFILLALVQLIFNIVILKKGFEVKYTPCLIGGLDSKEYFSYVEQGISKGEIRRKMLVAIADLTEKAVEEGEKKTSVLEEVIQSNG